MSFSVAQEYNTMDRRKEFLLNGSRIAEIHVCLNISEIDEKNSRWLDGNYLTNN